MGFFENMIPVIIIELDNIGFVGLFEIINDQSNKFHTGELMKREFKPSKSNPYDRHPIPVYKRGYKGKMVLVKGNDTYIP